MAPARGSAALTDADTQARLGRYERDIAGGQFFELAGGDEGDGAFWEWHRAWEAYSRLPYEIEGWDEEPLDTFPGYPAYPPADAQARIAQRERVGRLAAQGVALPEYSGWGSREPVYYDIGLSGGLQYFTQELCSAYGVGGYYELVLAKIFRESSFCPQAVSGTGDYGLAQINSGNHGWLRDELGITDFLDPEQSIIAGVHMLSGYLLAYEGLGAPDGVHRALMAYNMGAERAAASWGCGERSTGYSRGVVATWEKLLETGGVG